MVFQAKYKFDTTVRKEIAVCYLGIHITVITYQKKTKGNLDALMNIYEHIILFIFPLRSYRTLS